MNRNGRLGDERTIKPDGKVRNRKIREKMDLYINDKYTYREK